jgi:O-antigen/teichoic acid export membrane protein
VLVSAFREVYEPILRLHDRFTSVIVPQVAGALVTLTILAAYFATADGYNLKVIVLAFAIGVFVQAVPPLALALRLLQPSLAGLKMKPAVLALARYRHELLRCLFHSNLSGYLKLAINPGDIFLLGLFSTPAQVAVYGLARQLTAPLALLQTNAQTAVAPEVIALIAKRKFAQLKRLIGRYVVSASILSGLSGAGGLLVGHVFVVWLSRPAYLVALPVFYVLLVIASLMLVVAVFRPLSVGLDLMRWYNLGLLLSVAIVFVLARLNALTVNSQGRDEATAGGA